MKNCMIMAPDIEGRRATAIQRTLWPVGSKITVSNVNMPNDLWIEVQNFVKNTFKPLGLGVGWTWLDNQNGMIRIGWKKGGGSWSALGIDCLEMSGNTMQFGWLDKKVVIHEFCHALGLGHSHNSKNFPYTFNMPVVYKKLGNNWDKATIDRNILRTKEATIETNWEPGITGYYFDKSMLMEGISIEPSDTLSKGEIELLKLIYPIKQPESMPIRRIDQVVTGSTPDEFLLEIPRDGHYKFITSPRNLNIDIGFALPSNNHTTVFVKAGTYTVLVGGVNRIYTFNCRSW